MLSGNSAVARRLLACVLPLALSHCAGAKDSESTGASRDPILLGEVDSSLDSPVLYLSGPEGTCTATLVAPTLAVTARHCVAETPEGSFTCTPQGDLVMNGTGAGQIGADDAPGSLSFFTNAQVVSGTVYAGAPDALAKTIISTNTFTSCRDDIAFVVLDRAIPGVALAPVRIGSPTAVGETVSAWGYGLTTQATDQLALRVRNNAQIVGVGSDAPASGTQFAPLRAVRLGPDDVTCNGDSGGPIISSATGAVIAVASLGDLANFSTPTCTDHGTPDTTGPRLAEYRDLALEAFAAAGASPVLENTGGPDAAVPEGGGDDASEAPEAGGELNPEGAPPVGPPPYHATGASCSEVPGRQDGGAPLVWLVAACAIVAASVRRRRRYTDQA